MPKKEYKHVFAFVLPLKEQVMYVKNVFNPDVVMTVCETRPVHEDYKLIFDTFKCVVTPSEFCKKIFDKQFGTNLPVFEHHVEKCEISKPIDTNPYIFYTIGNVLDQRKNIPKLIEAFIKCNFKNAKLVIKATCIRDVHWKVPNVEVINGLLSDEDIDKIHKRCHCYINFSKSEGVGMGAVEAAVRNKPVIITDYGGLKEYVKTPFIVHCEETFIGNEDFLFQPHMKWGEPSIEDLIKHMKMCYTNKITHWDHKHTREKTSGSMLRAKLANLSSTLARGSV